MTPMKPRMRQPHVCMRCGQQDVRVEYHSDVVDFRGLTLAVDGLANSLCGHCGHIWTTDGQEQDNLAVLKAAYAAKRDETREREGLLTGEQVAYVLEELHLSRAEAAALFGGGPNAFGKYISGDVLQSYAMDRLLRLTLAFADHAVRYLNQGRDAPLRRGAGGYFLAPVISAGVSISVTSSAPVGQVRITSTRSTPTDVMLQA